MDSKLYLRFWLSFAFCLFCVFIFAFSLSQSRSLKKEKNFLKQNIKLDSLLYLNQLNKKLEFLIAGINQIKQEGIIPTQSHLSALLLIHQSKIEKIYLESTANSQTDELTKLTKIIETSQLHINPADKPKIQFKKIKEDNKNYFILIRAVSKDKQEIAFFKNNSSFFKIPALKNEGSHFVATDSKNNIIFYNVKIKRHRRDQLLERFLKTGASKYITIKNKKKSDTDLYYLHKWEKTNLYLISQLKNSALISKSAFFAKQKHSRILILTFIVLFCCGLYLFWLELSSLALAYTFLKSAIISFSKEGVFPLSQSKNPLLYFYNNRNILLNKKKLSDEGTDKSADKTFQTIIRAELEKLKSRYPNMTARENFNSNVKVFGFERFLRTVIHELLLNSLESMGAMEKQEIDLTVTEKENNLVFSIRDYGIGLPNT
ncbi:MAG: ATP-binding protein, partial [Oligoflexia bacterium]|nr:ATP-binding protein [Oligoflexia bacterium]